MAPSFQLDYVSHQPTLHFIVENHHVPLPKEAEHCLIKQIIEYERRHGIHPAQIIYYDVRYCLNFTDDADTWLKGVWLANTPSAYAHTTHQ